jgi:RNA polymerase sigma-70 factor, ECF subfamily
MKALALTAGAAVPEIPDETGWLIEAARSGDMAAFEGLMRRYERLVLVTALRLLGNLEDAQDASQEVFLRLYRNLGKLGGAENIPGWLYRVTANVCADQRRRRPATAPVEEAEPLVALSANPGEAAEESERRRALALSLNRLSERERAAVVLRDLEGLSTEEVARALGTNQATVRSQISQGRAKMKGFLERYFRRRV